MRALLYVPIIHMSADLGSLAKNLAGRGIKGLGEETWEKHRRTVSMFWDSIAAFFEKRPVAGFRIYQDGMVANGGIAEKIIEEGIRRGSKNYEIIRKLAERGAVLQKTEDLAMVKEERDWLLRITRPGTLLQKLKVYLAFMAKKNRLLKRRDGYMADTINRTLGPGETGILFIGAYHEVIPLLDPDIAVSEIKEVRKVRQYQKRLPYRGGKKDPLFEKLSDYLAEPVADL
ncbi:MAG: hypothetical protein M0Z58_08475 [Nitrospiraceae bacterium]|nr:hypothetical protein [Nitrospiraceae bacterium]